MKTTNYILALSLLVCGLTACTNEETGNGSTTDSETLDISAGLTITLPAEANTRAGNILQGETTAFINKAFSVIVKDNRADKNNVSLVTTTAATNTTLIENASFDEVGNVAKVNPAQATLAPKLYWDDLGGKLSNLNLVGIHPTTANPGKESDLIAWNVGTDQSAGTDAADLMLAYRPGYTYANKAIAANLNFNHVMAKVTINVIKGTNYEGAFATVPQVQITNLPVSGKVNIVPVAGGAYTITDKQSATITPTTPVLIENTTDYTTTALVVPTTVPAGTIIATITIGGNLYNVKMSEQTDIVAGCNNVINVTVKKVDVNVSATITGWTKNEYSINTQLVEVSVLPIADTEITPGSTLLVSIKDAKNKVHQVKYIATTKENGLYWVVSGNPLYWDNIAYPTDGSKLTADALLRVGGETSNDICTGSFANITGVQPKLELALTRKMSKITIRLKTTTGDDKVIFTDKDVVTLPQYKTFTVSDVTLTTNTTPSDIAVPYAKKEDAEATWVYETIIIPQTIDKSKHIITIKIGDNTYNVPVSVSTADEVYLGSRHYVYTITIKKIGVTVSATITGWEQVDKPNIDTDLDK